MDVVEFRPTPDQYAWTFGGAPPTHRIRPGTVLKLWTEDAFSGRLQRSTDRPSQVLDMTQVNPQTGPFHVEGAEPGDTLALHIADLTPARDWAASTTIPFFGALTHPSLLHEPLPERTWIYQLDRARGTVLFEATSVDLRLELPLAPMLGTVGVAPPGREVRSSLVPDTFGGNMDTPEMRPGTTCYLGVNVPGALFSVGDGHYRQGEGESCGTAVEGAMDVTLIVELIKGSATTPPPAWPRLEHDDHYAVVGSARPLEDAWRASQVGMISWLGELYGLDPLDAYQLLTQISHSPLANVCDTNYSAVTKIEKRLLPAADAFGGMHRHLRDQARSLDLGRTVDLQLAGRTALVTGGTKGIGRAVVEALAQEGAKVAFCARTAADVEAAESELTAAGHEVAGTPLDVADGDALAAWVAASAERFGGIDVAVANVSALAIGPGEANWKSSFEVDLMHTVRLSEAALPHLEASKGSIIAVSSVSGREIDFAKDAYGTMKAAVVHYIAGLAFQLAASGVRANCVSPGNTYFPDGVWAGIEGGNPELFATALGLNPTGRMASPQEIAYAVTMLASPRASFITGTNLVVDGALTRGVQL